PRAAQAASSTAPRIPMAWNCRIKFEARSRSADCQAPAGSLAGLPTRAQNREHVLSDRLRTRDMIRKPSSRGTAAALLWRRGEAMNDTSRVLHVPVVVALPIGWVPVATA